MNREIIEKRVMELIASRDAIIEDANKRIHEHNGAIVELKKLLSDMESQDDKGNTSETD